MSAAQSASHTTLPRLLHDDAVLPRPDGTTPFLLVREPTLAQLDKMIVFDQGIHFIDTMRFLFGKIARVYARVGHYSPLIRADDQAVIILEFETGVTGVIDISYSSYMPGTKKGLIRGNGIPLLWKETQERSSLICTMTTLSSWSRPPASIANSARPGLTPADAYQESFINTQRHFATCMRSGKPAQNELDDNLAGAVTDVRCLCVVNRTPGHAASLDKTWSGSPQQYGIPLRINL